jgi:Flp pilus assembly protein TadD
MLTVQASGEAGFARILKTLAIAAAGLAAGACSLGSAGPQLAATQPAGGEASKPVAAADSRSELQKATEYWGKEYAKKPNDAQTALNYARNLKAMGEKRQALAVLQQASQFNGTHRGINGEYGRLALEFDQISLAQKLLEQADDPTNPDWKIISARGTALAKQNKYRDAIAFYERALTLAPGQASILNNLALAHAMDGDAAKAEEVLKRVAASGGQDDARIAQNLALVLGLQGKYDEAKLASARALPGDKAAENVDYVRRMVKLDPKPMTKIANKGPELKGATVEDGAAASAAWSAQVAKASTKAAP